MGPSKLECMQLGATKRAWMKGLGRRHRIREVRRRAHKVVMAVPDGGCRAHMVVMGKREGVKEVGGTPGDGVMVVGWRQIR